MSTAYDFERAWLAKFARGLDQHAGETIRQEVMQGSEGLSSASSRAEVIRWSQGAMERLQALVDEEAGRAIMAGCACQYPTAALQEMREVYGKTGDVGQVHQMLQERFEAFLRDTLELEEGVIDEVVRRGWGLAGIRQGRTIIATKIPKSAYLVPYLQEPDPDKRRQLYCHCPRIRDALQREETIPPLYCYCGAGYYQGIWEEILQEPVEVEVLKSVLQGDDVCTVAIYLPPERAGGSEKPPTGAIWESAS